MRNGSKPFMIGCLASTILVSNVAGAVALELGTDQGDVFRRVEEAIRRTVQRHEAAALLDVSSRAFSCSGVIDSMLA